MRVAASAEGYCEDEVRLRTVLTLLSGEMEGLLIRLREFMKV